jgi:hypothetical protein
MSAAGLLLCFTVGAALLALWCDERFPRLAPPSLKRRIVHMGAAIVAAQFLAPTAMRLLGSSTPMLLTGLVALFLPALVYAFLTSVWVLRELASALPGR